MNLLNSIPFFKTIQSGYRMSNYAFASETDKYRRKQNMKMLLYTITQNSFAKKWFGILAGESMKTIVKNRPRLFVKPFRPYLSATWKKTRIVQSIIDSYDFLREKGLIHIVEMESVLLSTFSMKDELTGKIILCYDERFRKEGEFVIKFICDDLGGAISLASIGFERDGGDWVCRIGCIQGNSNNTAESIKQAQLSMYGLRPKVLMIFAIQQICRSFGITNIYGAGDQIQAHKRKHALHIPWIHKIDFSYDTIWKEEGGELENDGWYRIPAEPKRKTVSEMKVHKRAYYRKRYEIEQAIADGIEANLSEMRRVQK